MINRRTFLKRTGSAALLATAGCAATRPRSGPDLTIIDCHTHFYDPARPQGVPWPNAGEAFLYRTILPADYRAQPVPTPVTGTVVVEASPWVEDNQWILDLAAGNPFIVGFCGNLDPADPEFAGHLARFAANPLYRGIRVSGDGLIQSLQDSDYVRNLGRLADRGLQLDVNVSVAALPEIARLATAIPSLRIVIDHLANTTIDGRAVNAAWRRAMEQAATRPNVYAKVSGLVEAGARHEKPASTDTGYYAPSLDVIWNAFGEDRLIYGSNWPVSGLFAALHDVQRMVEEYFRARGGVALAKVLSGNARTAYGWQTR